MGLPIERTQFTEDDFARFQERLRRNLVALRELLGRPGFGQGPVTLGAELEVALVGRDGLALQKNREILDENPDPRLQLELDRFNLEYNFDPLPAEGRPFTALEQKMCEALALVDASARRHDGRVVAVGILPTLRSPDVQSGAMTDLARFHALSAGIRGMRRGEPFEIRIEGEEPLNETCDDVTMEGANTSLQIHLRVEPREFADSFNAVQMVTPLAVAIGANSPIFLGHKLWDETRVALFRQSVDGRPPEPISWMYPPRVSYGHGWVRRGAYELFAEGAGLFTPLMPVSSDDDDPVEEVRSGGVPRLAELCLHNGTVWRWNRPIYDASAGGHLRIEMRALPAGPTPADMVASTAFLLGLSVGLRLEMERIVNTFPFKFAEYNFDHAARYGLDARLLWPTREPPSPREVTARELLREQLPVAEEGLAALGIDRDEAGTMLDRIRARLDTGTTGARWQLRVLDRLDRRNARFEALRAMLEAYVRECATGRPVAEWSESP